MKKGAAIRNLFVGIWAVLFFVACSSIADGDAVEIEAPSSSSKARSSSSMDSLSSSSVEDSTAKEDSLPVFEDSVKFVMVPAQSLNRGATVFSVDSFEMSAMEVSQGLYKKVMGEIPKMDKVGDSIAVANVDWFDAVLFCNAFSKMMGMDTAYVYGGVESSGILSNLEIDYSAQAVRLPTETEWEVAARAGTSTKYYWDTDVASKYAYYGQTNGPVKTGQYIPNEYGLYDMGGNVAEWVNDWYESYSVQNVQNSTGPSSGTYRVIRGGGWSSKATSMASAEREKKDPLYHSQMVGFRVVRSKGF